MGDEASLPRPQSPLATKYSCKERLYSEGENCWFVEVVRTLDELFFKKEFLAMAYIKEQGKTKNREFNFGPCFDFLGIGFVILFCGIILSAFLSLYFLILVPLGIIVVLSIKGIEFDPNQMGVRVYYNLLFARIGTWIPYSSNDEFWLYKPSDYHRPSGFRRAEGLTGPYTYHFVVTFVRLEGDNIDFEEFSDYYKAHDYMHKLVAYFGMNCASQFKEELIESFSKPRRS